MKRVGLFAKSLGAILIFGSMLAGTCSSAYAQVVGWGVDSNGSISGISGATNVKQVAAGNEATIVLYTNGTLGAFGDDNGLGIITQLPSGSDYTQVSCMGFTGLALRDNGTVVAWGNNGSGQANVPSGLTNVIQIAAGDSFSMALKDDGTVVSWGDNTYGEISGSSGVSNVIAVAAVHGTAYALKSDGTVVAWGYNGTGQATVPVGLSDVVAVAGSGDASIALLSNGTVVTWGSNSYGEQNVPAGLSGVISVFGNGSSLLGALKSDGTVVEWGFNGGGQGTVPSNLYGVTSVSAGTFETIAIVGDQSAVAWGSNTSGQTNIPGISSVKSVAEGDRFTLELLSNGTVAAQGDDTYGGTSVPAGLSGVAAIATGDAHCLALLDNGTVVAWGQNSYGETTIPSGLTGVKAIAAGHGFSVALLDDGTLVEWGLNNYGQTTIPGGLSEVKAIAAGYDFVLALQDDGRVTAWGADYFGQTTVPNGTTSGIAAISAGVDHSLALGSGGTVAAWGNNMFGATSVPGGLAGVAQVSAGDGSSQVLLSNGTVESWGLNLYGELKTPTGLIGTMVATNWETTVALAQPAVVGLSLSPSTLVGGNTMTGTIVVSPAAGPAGETVTISGSGPATLPSTVTVPAGANSATITLPTSVEYLPAAGNVTATLGTTSANAVYTANTLVPTSVTFSSSLVEGGTSDTGTVTISSDPGPEGATVALSGTGPWTIPASVTIPGGSTSVTFPVATTNVSTSTLETVSASISGYPDLQVVTSAEASGTFTLTFNGQTTGPLAYNATASQVQTALNGLSSIGGVGGSVTCAGGPVGTSHVLIVFGGTLASGQQPLITATGGPTVVDWANVSGSFTTTPAQISAFSTTQGSVVGGSIATFIVTLDTPAGPSGDLVFLSGTGPIDLPSSVLVPAGSNTTTFTASTSTVGSNQNEQVTAMLGASSKDTTVTVTPATVASVELAAQSVTGGSNIQASLTLSGAAPTGGLAVNVTTSNGAVQPTTLRVPAGSTTYNFALKTSAVSSKVWVKITVGGYSTNIYIVPATISNLTAPPSVQAGSLAEVQIILNGPAGPSGDVVSLSSNSAAVTAPASMTVPAGAKTMWIGLKTNVVASSTSVTVTGTTGSVSQTATFSVVPSGLQAISVTPNSVLAGTVVQAKVTLVHPTSNVVTINLSSNSAAAPVPATASIGPEASSYSFLIRTKGVSSSTQATITATLGSGSVTTTLTITPSAIVSFSVTPGSITGGTNLEATITLNGAAPAAAVVSVSSSSADVVAPAHVTIPAGSTHYSFLIKTKAVKAGTQATITASMENTFGSATVTLTP